MIDDLDLAFDDDYDRGRHRRKRRGARGSGGGPRKRRRGRTVAALLMTLVLLGILGGAGWYGFGKVQDYFAVKDYSGPGTGSVTVQVSPGDGGTDIGNKLVTAGVVESAKAFVNAFTDNPDSQNVEPGFYKLHKQMKASLAVSALLARDGNNKLVNKVSETVTIPEGLISLQIFDTLSKATNIPVADFKKAAANPEALGVPSTWFTREDGKPVPTPHSIEGFLYPDTYEFDPGTDATTILKTMVNGFIQEATKLDFVDTVQQKFGISPYEGLIAASIAQVEAVRSQDMPGVARVLYNRAYKPATQTQQVGLSCSCLQLDSTVNYWLRVTGKAPLESGDLTYSQLHDTSNPYDTYDKPGMPPGPISNPGADALTGAMTAPSSNNYFFLAIDKNGTTAFAPTYSQFCADTQKAKNNGVNIGVCTP
ncbi:endolytic transglycosylase MltG [Rugosimonospora acidiphila]|uniref:Endolytic murein transglycosylase n=1 Tax=Rugosimonospora acidiphila TaxID=556531 RepID=A0ABP9SUT7_9ACTN